MEEKKFEGKGKNRYPRKGKKDFRKDKAAEESSSDFKAGNDFAWWNKVPELLSNAANLKSNWIAGNPIDEADINYIVPGVVRIRFRETYGVSYGATHPLNVWSRDLYLRMFQKWRGISAYEYPDLGITILSQVEVVRMIAKLERIYGVVTRYSKANVNMPFTEAAALGLTSSEADWIRGHLSDYRYDLNELIRKAQRLCIPKDMSVLSDSISLLGYEYLDHENTKAQIILFDSEHFGVYDETTLQTGGMIQFKQFTMATSPRLIDVTGASDNMFEALEFMLDALLGSSSVNRILGDLLTWFGESQMLSFEPLPEDYMVAPVYSESILHKMHNLECCANPIYAAVHTSLSSADITALKAINDFVIYQYDNNIISRPVAANPAGPSAYGTPLGVVDFEFRGGNRATNLHHDSNSVIDTYRVDANEETVTEGVIWKTPMKEASFSTGGNTYYTYEVQSTSFQIVSSVELFSLTVGGTVTSMSLPNMQATSPATFSTAGYYAVLDWAPLTYHVDSTTGKFIEVAGDIDTPIPLPVNACIKLHKAINYSGLHTEIRVLDSIHN